MSRVYKCDRCGAIYEVKDFPRYVLGYQWQLNSETNIRDLCSNCTDELTKWAQQKIEKDV